MRIDDLWISVVLIITIVAFATLSVAFTGGMPWGTRMPDLTPIPLFYLVLRQPTTISVGLVFVIGLAIDLLYGRLVGTGALTFLILYELLRWRVAGRPPPPLHWEVVGFVIFTTLHTLLIAVIGFLTVTGTATWNEAMWQIIGTTVLYPLAGLLVHGIFRIPAQTNIR